MYAETDYAESDPGEEPFFIILQQNISLFQNTLKFWERVCRLLTPEEIVRYNIRNLIKKCKKDLKMAINEFMNY